MPNLTKSLQQNLTEFAAIFHYWFQIQYNSVSAKFIELSSCWRTYTTEQSQYITIQTDNCRPTQFTNPRYIIVTRAQQLLRWATVWPQ